MRPVAVAGFVLLVISGPTSWGGSGARFEADVNVGFFSGDYGGDTTTDVQMTTPRLRWALPRGTVRVSFPFMRISDPGGVAIVGGTPVAAAPDETAPAKVGLPDGMPTSVTGPGDLRVDGELDLVRGGDRRPWVTGSVRLKLPTADEDEGLGTGETDVEGGLALTQTVGRQAYMLDLRHSRLGDPEGYDFRDVTSVGAGVFRQVGDGGRTRVWGYLENRTHPNPGRDDRFDVSVGVSRSLRRVRLSGSAFVGLSGTAEDFGLSLTVGR